MMRELFTLPARLGGLRIPDLVSHSSKDYSDSIQLTSPLSELILLQKSDYSWEALDAQLSVKQAICREREATMRSVAEVIKAAASDSLRHAMALAQEKGASNWLTSLPLDEFGFSLHKGAFRDALAL